MLAAAHKHLLVSRLRDVFQSSPLVLVYQSLGNVRSDELAFNMQHELELRAPGCRVRHACLKLKITVAWATGSEHLARFLQTNNVLIGWQLPEFSTLDKLRASRAMDLRELLQQPASTPAVSGQHMGHVLDAGKADTVPSPGQQGRGEDAYGALEDAVPPGLPHKLMQVLIQLSIGLPRKQPLALLASFYRGEQVSTLEVKK